jgi:hypothetical protein
VSELVARDVQGRWLPGASPNPGGRPAGLREIAALARECTTEALEQLRSIMLDPRAAAMARVKAAEVLLDRGWGKPASEVELAELARSADGPIVFKFQMGEDEPLEIEASDLDDELEHGSPVSA